MNDSAYSGLLVNDAHWAFGTDFEDPLAGVDTSVPPGVDPAALAAYSLMLGDDALVLSHRLSEWCSNAPDLEDDIALANISLDLLGQARILLARAAAADPSVVPVLPETSPVPAEDRLAFFREQSEFRNVLLVEQPNGDFAETIARLFVFSAWRLALLERLVESADPVLAALAAKGVKEVAYHREYAARWFVTLAQGTAESRARTEQALGRIWPDYDELSRTHPIEQALAGVAVATAALDIDPVIDHVLDAAGLTRPAVGARLGIRGRSGRDGVHTEALGLMLAEMQSVARAHPEGLW